MPPETPDTVWTGFVRLTHWLVASCVLVNLFNDTGYWHRVIGYVSLIAVLTRISYGLWLSQHAASKLYLPTLASIKHHISELLRGDVSPYIGHNSLGQLAVYAMWLLIIMLGFTGWLCRTDTYWGEDWPVDLHQLFANVLKYFVVLHLLAIVLMSALQKQNLIKQMLTGKISLPKQ